MPKNSGYRTGGQHPGKGLSKYEYTAGSAVNVTASGAGMGTNYGTPHMDKNKSGAGGHGTSGTPSRTTSKKG
jgi:hypothetical protein